MRQNTRILRGTSFNSNQTSVRNGQIGSNQIALGHIAENCTQNPRQGVGASKVVLRGLRVNSNQTTLG